MNFQDILMQENFDNYMIVRMLNCNEEEAELLKARANEVRLEHIGNEIHGRALIELSNICKKDCYYCGIRKSNTSIERYQLTLEEIKGSIDNAINSKIGSMAIQSGEITSPQYIELINDILKYIKSKDKNIGITLSCGEHPKEVYKKWKELGAERFLLRIETSNKDLYYQYHPKNKAHDYQHRLDCLQSIKDIGFQTGTGVMIGLPNQEVEHLADDIIFMRDFGIHMCGMGPFIACNGTPMENSKSTFDDVFETSLRMISVLRIVMKDINIVASTAMETMHPQGRKLAILAGANIIMPNLNPSVHRKKYSLYNKKTTTEITTKEDVIRSCQSAIPEGFKLGLDKKGTSPRWLKTLKK